MDRAASARLSVKVQALALALIISLTFIIISPSKTNSLQATFQACSLAGKKQPHPQHEKSQSSILRRCNGRTDWLVQKCSVFLQLEKIRGSGFVEKSAWIRGETRRSRYSVDAGGLVNGVRMNFVIMMQCSSALIQRSSWHGGMK
jgi:hypothetical protein